MSIYFFRADTAAEHQFHNIFSAPIFIPHSVANTPLSFCRINVNSLFAVVWRLSNTQIWIDRRHLRWGPSWDP